MKNRRSLKGYLVLTLLFLGVGCSASGVDGADAGVANEDFEIDVTYGNSNSESTDDNSSASRTDLRIEPSEMKVALDGRGVLEAFDGEYPYRETIEWWSKDPEVARVDVDGVVEPTGLGEATIVAETTDGVKVETAVHVVERQFRSVTTGFRHTCALDADDRAWCWGLNEAGALGRTQPAAASRPHRVDTDVRFQTLVAGEHFTCGLSHDDEVWCWGLNTLGRLGNDTKDGMEPPTKISHGYIRGTVVDLVAGSAHACVLTDNGKPYCWGANQYKQAGDRFGSPDTLVHPTPAKPGRQSFTSIHAGALHTCALTADSEAWCWGANFFWQTGVRVRNSIVDVPRPIWTDLRFQTLDGGHSHTCAVTVEGQMVCWGLGEGGQLGVPPVELDEGISIQPRSSPRNLQFREIASGFHFSCGISMSDRLYCWGWNEHAQAGGGGQRRLYEPSAVHEEHRFESIDAGQYHACGVTIGGEIRCWGLDGDGRLGSGRNLEVDEPRRIESSITFTGVSTGESATCGRNEAGEVHCWGRNTSGQLGLGHERSTAEIERVKSSVRFRQVEMGKRHSCGISLEDDVYCWGVGVNGALGLGDERRETSRPEQVSLEAAATDLAVGRDFSQAVTSSKTRWAWGNNRFGQLAAPDDRPGEFAVEPSEAYSVTSDSQRDISLVSVDGGYHHACSLDELRSRAICWGDNRFGQVEERGFSTSSDVTTGPDGPVKEVVAGRNHSCAVTENDDIECWGKVKRYAKNGPPEKRGLHEISSEQHLRDLTAQGTFTCGLNSEGEAYCWGRNQLGVLGDGSGEDSLASTVAVAGGHTFVDISAGERHACGVTADGEMWCWGANTFGEVGTLESLISHESVLVNVPNDAR